MADQRDYRNMRGQQRPMPRQAPRYSRDVEPRPRTMERERKGGGFWAWIRPVKGDLDYQFLIVVGLLITFGLVMLFSASSARAFANFGDSLWYLKRQIRGIILGGVAMYFLSKMDYHRWGGKVPLLCVGGSLILLVLVLIPGLGRTVNGATRWIFGFQPSETAKMAVILFFSHSLAQNQDLVGDFRYGILPYLGLLGLFIILLALEPHFSCIILLACVGGILLFVGGAKLKHLGLICGAFLTLVVGMIIVEPYRMKRIVSFLDPFADLQGSGWQIVQSLYAIGSGGIFGVGLGQSRQKYQSLPEPQNDFIFSVLAEELGLFGVAILIVLFAFLIYRGIKIAAKAPDLFGSLLVTGIVGMIAMQVLINIAVVTSVFPVTGMPLPFFSYGSTALIITMAEMGIVLNVSRQSKLSL